jgi:TRAP-type C4-dicarboxylate transport system permease small subunit
MGGGPAAGRYMGTVNDATGNTSASTDRPANAYKRVVVGVSHKGAYVAAVMMLAMMLLTVSDVCLRYFFNSPIVGGYELTGLFMIMIFAPSLAWTAAREANVRVDLIVNKFPARAQGIFDSFTCLLSLIVTVAITWFTIPQTMFVYDIMTVSDQLDIPFYPFYIIITIGFFLLIFPMVNSLLESIHKAVRG